MRGHFRDQGGLFSYISPETRVPAWHPLRQIREHVRAEDLRPGFGKLYASEGRPSIPPEQLLSALLRAVATFGRLDAAFNNRERAVRLRNGCSMTHYVVQ
jgi:hypothetical protein